MWQTGSTPDQEKKEAFVSLWLRSNDPFEAAIEIFGREHAGRALQASVEWPKDAFCLALKEKLLDEQGLEAFLPTKAEFAQMLLTEAKDCRAKADKHKFMELYAKTMKYVNNEPAEKGKVGGVTVMASEVDQKL